MAVWVCYDIAKKNPRYNITMIMLATAEIYGGKSHIAQQKYTDVIKHTCAFLQKIEVLTWCF